MPDPASTNGLPSAPGGRNAASPSRWGLYLPALLFLADLFILYVAFVGAYKARLGTWALTPQAMELEGPLLITMGVYAAALALSGLYRLSPRRMHLGAYLRIGGTMLVAWTASVTLMYLVSREAMAPRSITAIHCLLSLVGILGLRAVLRQISEWMRPAARPIEPKGIQMDDLLPRSEVEIDTAALRNYLAGRTVLVTGAGGSIGTELTEQLAALQPFRLVLVDVSEYNLFQLENALRERRFDGELEFCIADVRDEDIMRGLFANFQPDLVLHAAAYKHVPLMERHPMEAFRNNTLATVNLLQLCEAYEAEQFVLVSTDKAVEPSSVLGATKRLAEWYVRAATSEVQRKIVRFGNVFGSQGSVVPLFEEQIASGEPARVTHPDMERYFMSADEACSLILQTILLDEAPIYIFDMGEPVSIRWLAEEIVRRLRPEADPADFIEYTGVRPGEKLSEELWTTHETPQPTAHARILGLNGPVPYSRAELELYLRHLEGLCQDHHAARLRKALFATDFDAAIRQE